MFTYYHDDGTLVPNPSSARKSKRTKPPAPYAGVLVPFLSGKHSLEKTIALFLAVFLVGGAFAFRKQIDIPAAIREAPTAAKSIIEVGLYLTPEAYLSGARSYSTEMTEIVTSAYRDLGESSMRAISLVAQKGRNLAHELYRNRGNLFAKAGHLYELAIVNLFSLGSGSTPGTSQVASVAVSNTESNSKDAREHFPGISLFDEVTGEPYCVKVIGGVATLTEGACEAAEAMFKESP